MFFRIWFLYLCKLAVLGFILALAGFVIDGGDILLAIGLWIIVPLGIAGGILGVTLAFIKRTIACPICGKQSTLFFFGSHQPGVLCEKCGCIYCKSIVFSFRLIVETPDADD